MLFRSNWTVVEMSDDGLNGDAAAGDFTYTAILPAAVQKHRRLIRYRLRVRDPLGAEARVPYNDDASKNFAYFVYDGIPAWTGAVQPGVTPRETFSAEVMNSVPAWHLLTRSADYLSCQYDPSANDGTYKFEGALVLNGRVYDHVFYRPKEIGRAHV